MIRKSRDIPQSEHNETRMRRAWSWFHLSEKSRSHDEKFIFLWIAFNAAYGKEHLGTSDDDRVTERDLVADFVNKVVERDHKKAIEKTLWSTFSGPVRVLLENKFVFGHFWNWIRERSKGKNWESKFTERKRRAFEALGRHDVSRVLEEVLARLYVLRNQIIHGGTTFAKGVGRDQVRDGSKIMNAIIPEILKIMQKHIDENPDSSVWGKLDYPRVGDDDQPDRMSST